MSSSTTGVDGPSGARPMRLPQQIADDTFAAEARLGGSEMERLERAAVGAARVAASLLARTTSRDVTAVDYLSDLGTAARWAQAYELLNDRMLAVIAAASPLPVAS